ncbi:MAG: hypothetical protein FWB91_11280 [Defluviitaleaceae bacterium]|nr:hypothetical protein [Defluviitaleaceae bacterium]
MNIIGIDKMFRLGIIEESLESLDTLALLAPFFFSQRISEVPEETPPVWHINEYHVPDDKIVDLLPTLEQQVKPTWYIHAFNDERLVVILREKSFFISPHKDETWDEMVAYGESVNVERRFLENIPLAV